jgi:glycosyltransferase involved in cell wall biosynthesis
MMPPKSHVHIDVSSLLHWTGPAVGMMRVEHEMAVRAGFTADDVDLCYYDVASKAYRSLQDRYARQLVGWSARLEQPSQARAGWRRLLPDRARALMALERLRLTTRFQHVAALADKLQRFLLSLRAHRFPLDDEQGRRIDIVPFDLALGEILTLGPDDVILSIASDWWQKDAKAIIDLKRRSGFRIAALCYDVIPLRFPQFYAAEDVARFRSYWEQMFGFADLVIVNARCIGRDIQDYCSRAKIEVPRIAVVPLGCDPVVAGQTQLQPLRRDLEPERYVLYVSTIEPRKNHALLMRVWKRFVTDGIVGANNFKLVFVGRRGWLTDQVQAEIDTGDFSGTLLHIEDADDRELALLYENAAFCVYPSRYEGFGLPVVEAYARGKAVLVSNGGALAELTRDGGLDPDDDEAWSRAISALMTEPGKIRDALANVEDGIRNRGWPDVVADMMASAKSVYTRSAG